MSTLTRAAVHTTRIAAVTAAAPVRAGAAASAATAKLVGWELQLLARSPLSVGAMGLRAKYRELAAANGATADTPARLPGRARHPDGTAGHSSEARARLDAVNSSR